MSSLRARLLARLREQMRHLEKPGIADRPALSLGPAAIDDALPAGGLAGGSLHEIGAAPEDAAAYGFAACLLGRLAKDGVVLWCRRARGRDAAPYAPGLARFGLAAGRLILVHAPDQASILWSMEEGLRSGRFAGMLGEAVPDLTATRRLQLAAESSGATALLLSTEAKSHRLSAATTRWRIASLPAADPVRPRWQVTLERCRGGAAHAWTVEWNHEALRFDLVSALGDRPLAAAAR